MNDEIKNKIKRRDIFYKQLKKYKLNLTEFDAMSELTSEFFLNYLSEKRKILFSTSLKS